ncbi:hypothetical protein [Promicromonospora sp. NPDC023805]
MPGRLRAGTSNGTRVVIWDCGGQANQRWMVGQVADPVALTTPSYVPAS